MGSRIIEICIGHDCESIRKHHLLNQTAQNKNDSALEHNCRGMAPVLDLRDKLARTNDRTSNKMREKGDEQRVVDQILDRLHFSPIDIECIRKAGEGVKADPDRKNNL